MKCTYLGKSRTGGLKVFIEVKLLKLKTVRLTILAVLVFSKRNMVHWPESGLPVC
jgi:hypothetical protein